MQRFYDVQGGTVEVDGVPVTDLNVGSLRALLGVVSQEPKLFAMTVRDCIAMGTLSGKGSCALHESVGGYRVATGALHSEASLLVLMVVLQVR